jgi:hypothetical protein
MVFLVGDSVGNKILACECRGIATMSPVGRCLINHEQMSENIAG